MITAVRRGLRADERGVSLILTSLAMVALLGITALVIDIGNANQRGRTAQSVADASAIAGGWELPTQSEARTTAAEYVADNLDATLPTPVACGTGASITADTVCYEIGSRDIWITTPWDGSDYLMRVEICDAVDTSFAAIIGFKTMNVCRYAISEVEPPEPPTPGGPAIQAFGPTDKKSFETTGAGTIWTDGEIFIASTAGEAFVANGTGGVTALGNVWYDSTGGGCAKPPHCGVPGFLDETSTPPVAGGHLPVGCDPAVDCPGGAEMFYDVYRDSSVTTIDNAELALCLTNGLSSAGCEAYNWPGAPTHTINNTVLIQGPDRTGDTTNPSCNDGSADMWPGYYSTTAQYRIKGCVMMHPGIYMFAGGFGIEASAFVQGNNVFLYSANDYNVSRITKSAVCLTGMTVGPYEDFLYYQDPANDGTFDVESDSSLFMAGIIYVPSGEVRIQGANAGTIGGDGSPGSGCLGETTLLGGSITGQNVLVKSDGMLAINSFSSGAASGGGSWVRLYE